MTISSTVRTAGPYISGTALAFTFKVFAAADLQVVRLNTTTGVETVLVLNSDYTVTLNGNQNTNPGGTVTLTVAASATSTVTITSGILNLQPTDLTNQGGFYPEVITDSFDRSTIQIQQMADDVSRSLKGPISDGNLNMELPTAALRANKYLVFDANGLPIPSAGSGTDTALRTDLANTGLTTAGAGLVGFRANDATSVGRTVLAKLRDVVSVKDFGAVGDGVTDDASAIQAAVDASAGRPVYFPTGTYLINSTINYVTTSSSVFTPGLKLFGDGSDKTIIDTRVSNGPAINIDTSASNKFQLYAAIEGLSIETNGTPSVASGIVLRKAYMVTIQDVWVYGLSGDGIQITMNAGDADGSNMVELNQCRIENCAGWGIDCDVTGPYNEISFVHMKHVFVQGCGTASVTVPPPSGGMRWKGQIITMDSCAFVICENVGVYVQGGAGLANTVIAHGVALENNRKIGLYCDGLDSMYWIRGHVYNNDSFIATRGMQFDGSTRTIKNILIDGIVVRATSGNNAIQAFTISGANAELNTCRVRNTSWQNFDYAGQIRFSGWQFDQISNDCELVALSSTAIRVRPTGRGNKIPHRLRGSGSTTGEWVQHELPSTGVNSTNSGLANSTQYYVYSYDNNGVIALELSTTVSTVDSSSGYSVKTGDATRFYVGSVVTDGSANFAITGTGWLNPTSVSGTQVGVPGYLWIDSTGDLRVKTTLPTSDTDGTVVGTQT